MKRVIFLTVLGVMVWASTCYSQSTGAGAGADVSSPGTDAGVSGSASPGSASPSGSASSPSSSAGAGAGASGASGASGAGGSEASLGAGSQLETIDFAATGNIKISRMGEKAPTGMNALAQGEIVNIDRANNKVTIRDSRTGSQVRYTLSESKLLKDLNQGDRVQVFSDDRVK